MLANRCLGTLWVACVAACLQLSCSGASSGTATNAGGAVAAGGGANSGGINATGGAGAVAGSGIETTALATGGASAVGGSSSAASSALPTGGAMTTGGAPGSGSTPASGGLAASGGTRATGGATVTGGASTTGGAIAVVGGNSASGGVRASGGAAATGGAPSTGGSTMVAGGTSGNCPLPSTFKWTSSGPLAQPKSGLVSLKDFSSVVYNNQHIVYMSTVDSAGAYGGAMMTFTDWPQMASATQNALPYGGVAPTLMYFSPKKQWILMYEWGPWAFTYLTSTDPTKATGWAGPYDLYEGSSIDETVVCTSTTCYLFFANDDGTIHRASMPIGSFPGTFTNATTIMTDTKENLFEAIQVYTVKGANKYLMIVEAMGSGGRYFRSFTATDLGGTWTPLAATESNPFAGKSNVTFNGSAWTGDISSGVLVRTNPDETQTVDPCNLQFLYQGVVPTTGLTYNQLPWQPGLLTLVH